MATQCSNCHSQKEFVNEACVDCGSFNYMMVCMCCAAPHKFAPDKFCPSCANTFELDDFEDEGDK